MVKLEKKLAPELRFSEFTSSWELKTLSNLISHIDSGWSPNCEEKVAATEEWGILKTTSTTWAGYNQHANKKLPNFLTPRTALEVKAGDILITRAGPVNRVGVVAFVEKTRPKLMISDKLIRVSKNDDTDGAFLARLISTSKSQKYLNARTSGLAEAQANISQKILSVMPLIVPGLAEQQKIAAFLSVVDDKLTNLRHKRELLENYKRGLMQQLFTQKIRFKQEDGSDFPDWASKTLSDVADITGGGTPETSVKGYWNGNINWFTPTEIKSKYLQTSKRAISELGLKQSSAKLLPAGTLLLSTRATIGDVGIAQRECATNQGFQNLLIKKNNYNEFWYYWIGINKHELLKRASGSTFPEISKFEIKKLPILSPCLSEQRKIANFLQSIDNKIDAVAKQINQLDTFKKGLLQKLFV